MAKETAQVAYEAAKIHWDSIKPEPMDPWERTSEFVRNTWRRAIAAAVTYFHFDEGNLTSSLARIEAQQKITLEVIRTMEANGVTRAQLDAAIQQLLAAEAARDVAVTTALTDLQAKVAAGTVVTPEDFTAELANLATLHANAAALTQTATADDPGSTVVPPTPLVDSTGEAKTADTKNSTTEKASTKLTLVASPASPTATDVITLTGSVDTGGGTTPTGSVTITDSTGVVRTTAALDSEGAFSASIGPLSAGSYSLNASYDGDDANGGSMGSTGFGVSA